MEEISGFEILKEKISLCYNKEEEKWISWLNFNWKFKETVIIIVDSFDRKTIYYAYASIHSSYLNFNSRGADRSMNL